MDLVELLHTWEPLSDEDAMPEIEDFPPEPFEIEWP
jgi:antitoxin VapB